MMNTTAKSSLRGLILLLCLALLVLASCATRLRIPEELEPERLLPTGAMAYLRVNPARATDLILPFIEPYGISQAADMLDRTESMVLAIMPPSSISKGQTSRPLIFGVASGRFPTRSLALKLNTDRHWSREDPGWVHKDQDLRLAFTSRGQILVGTAPLEMVISADENRPHPVPEFWRVAWNNDFSAFIPDPFSLLGNSLPVNVSGLPLESMLISTRRLDANYDLFIGFEFATERSAVVFAPLCRLFLYALAKDLWPQQATKILAAVTWTTQGSMVEASGLRLDVAQLTSLLALPMVGTTQASIGQVAGSK